MIEDKIFQIRPTIYVWSSCQLLQSLSPATFCIDYCFCFINHTEIPARYKVSEIAYVVPKSNL